MSIVKVLLSNLLDKFELIAQKPKLQLLTILRANETND